MEILHDNFPSCPEGNDELTRLLHYPSVVIIYLALALVSIIFAILTGVKYNSITVAKNRKISAEKISNVAWIAYYVIVACMSLVQAAEYVFEENYWPSLYLYVAGRILHGGTVMCLSFALNHQRKYRTYSATININNGEQQPLITHPQGREEPKTWGSLLVSIEGFLIVLFIIYMTALYLEMFTSSTETEQTFWIIFICVFVAQRIPLAVMAVTIVFNCKADGPTTRSRVLLIIAAILYFVNDLPASLWGKLYEFERRMSKKRVCYYYDAEVGNFHYGPGHPMKPHRIRMTHNLLLNYGLYKKMQIYRPPRTTPKEMTKFHTDDYVNFLRTVTPDNMNEYSKQLTRFNVGEDCPVYDGMFQFCQISAGGSVAGAIKLNHGEADIAINWAGGLHHAKKAEASGFCYVNDIVLAILELLKYHQRILYIDIDIHHGDGVEEAFYTTNRVMTVSFHKFGEYFPGTGDIKDLGTGEGKYYSINFPLKDGIDDESYQSVFKPLIAKIMEWYKPSAVVLQCGADSLAGDRLGCFNLSLHGHAQCVEYVKSFNVPTLVLGGGGYTIRNVSRCWTYETAIILDTELSNNLPYNDYLEYYGPDYKLHIEPSNMENLNSKEYLMKQLNELIDNLRHIEAAPSVPMQQVPADTQFEDEDEDLADPDVRLHPHNTDKKQHDGELYDSDDEEEGAVASKPDNWPREEMETDEKSTGNATGQAATPATGAPDSDNQSNA